MPFAVSMVWHEPQVYLNDCYFCMTNITGFSRFSVHKIEYANIPSALRLVPHDDSMPVPKPPESYTSDSDSEPEENKKMALHSEKTPGWKNMAHPALVDKSKIYLPPQRIKFALMKYL
jgi:hypothetical protein